MINESHPIKKMATQIEERGVMVLENVTNLPAYGESYVSPFYVVGLNTRGYLRAEFDFQPVEFHPHDIVVVYPNHIFLPHETSDDYLVTLLIMSSKFKNLLNSINPTHNTFQFCERPSFHLNEDQFEGILSSMKAVRAISMLNNSNREEMLAAQMDVFSSLLEAYMKQNGEVMFGKQSSVQQLLMRFQEAIAQHYRESREVQFYANLLYFTPKYFGSLIRQETGIGASDWIARYIVIRAKSMLRHRPDLTIQQISYQLGFPHQTAFTRYFKANAGMAPKDYRDMG